MSTSSESTNSASHRDELMAALFAQLVMQQANMAMMLLGKTAHPESGKTVKDLDAARLFIDELEMLEVKTKGNLTKDESNLLKQSLMSLRMAYVEAVEESAPEGKSTPNSPQTAGQPAEASGETQTTSSATPEPPASEEEHKKKFSKKY